MIGIDTNILVRYIAQDDPQQSKLASRLIEDECSPSVPGFVSLLVLVELVWVGESCYEASRVEVAQMVRRILSTRQLVIQDAEIAWKALRLFEASGKADFADCLIERVADSSGCAVTMTFDKAAAKAGMKLLA